MSVASSSISTTALASSIAAIAAAFGAILVSLFAVTKALKGRVDEAKTDQELMGSDRTAYIVQVKTDGDSVEFSNVPQSAVDSAIADLRRHATG
jgi:hypothetical protein